MDALHITLIITTILFLASTIVLGWACFNVVKKVEVYEGWLEMFRSEAEGLYARLKMVDEQNLFEKDDDVGFVFSEILRVTKEFNDTVK